MMLDERLVGIQRETLVNIEGRRFGLSSDGNYHVRGGIRGFKGKPIEIADAEYTINIRDLARLVIFTSNEQVRVFVPDTLPKGFHCLLMQAGTGTVRIVASGNASINQRLGEQYLGGQGALCNLLCYRVGYWVFGGDTGSGYPDLKATAAQSFPTITQVASAKALATGQQAGTLAALTMAAYGHNVDTPVSNGSANQTFLAMAQTAGATISGASHANQTLSTITQTARSNVLVQGDADPQTLATITQTARDQAAGAATYYISAAGSDSNDGLSESTPWLTITNIEAITGTQNSMDPGTRIRFRGGDTFNLDDGWYWGGQHGTASQPIVIDSYGTGKATFTNTGAADVYDIMSFWDDGGIGDGHDYITVDNIIFSGPGYNVSTNNYSGIFIDNTGYHNSNMRFTNCEFTGIEACVTFGEDGTNSGGTDGIYVGNCYFHDCRGAGFLTYGTQTAGTMAAKKSVYTGILVENCWAEDMGTEGICIGYATNPEVRYCVARHVGNLAVGCVGIWVYITTGGWIHHCEGDHCRGGSTGTGIDGDGFDLDLWVDHCLIEYCYAHDNTGAGILLYDGGGAGAVWTQNTCRYNICVNDGSTSGTYGSILFSGNGTAMPSNYVYNNTLIQQGAGRIALRTNSNAQGKVCNNLIYTDNATAILYQCNTTESASLTVAGNAYYARSTRTYKRNGTTYSTLAALQAVNAAFEKIGGVNVGYEDMPNFDGSMDDLNYGNLMTDAPNVNQELWETAIAQSGFGVFKLASNSPYKDAGRDLPTEFSLDVGDFDFWGNAIPAGVTYSIGAHDR